MIPGLHLVNKKPGPSNDLAPLPIFPPIAPYSKVSAAAIMMACCPKSSIKDRDDLEGDIMLDLNGD